MEKYITTKAHPFGEGHLVEIDSAGVITINLQNAYIEDILCVTGDSFESWKELLLVKEIQEPKWTDEDLDKIIYCWVHGKEMNEQRFIKDWIKENTPS